MFSDRKYLYGDQNVQVPAHLNFGKFMLNNLRKFQNVAIVSSVTKEELTYSELIAQIVRVSVVLKKLGVKIGDIVAVGSESRNEIIPTLIAATCTGATLTPLHIESGKDGLLHKLSITRPKYVICSALFWKTYGALLRTQEFIKTFICFDETPEIALCLKELCLEELNVDLFEPVEVKGQTDVAFVLYSSGTTGLPKGVMLTHLNCILNSLPEAMFNEESTVMVEGDWNHNYDIFMTCKFLNAGKTITYAGNYAIERVLKTVREHEVNVAILVPSTVMSLTKIEPKERPNLNSLKVIYSRSSTLYYKTLELLKSQYPEIKLMIQGYGMTEAGEPTSEKWGTKGPRTGSVGMVSPGTTLKVVDVATRESLGSNQVGEICVKGPVLMKGYIGVDPTTYLDEMGFLKTGDLGYYDEDGYVFIVDRIKEIMNLPNGDQVAPMAIEGILIQHPAVKEVAVVGKRDPEIGDLPTAFVVKEPESKVTEKELIDLVTAEMGQVEQLTGGLRFIPKLPRNSRGKVLRRTLKESLN